MISGTAIKCVTLALTVWWFLATSNGDDNGGMRVKVWRGPYENELTCVLARLAFEVNGFQVTECIEAG